MKHAFIVVFTLCSLSACTVSITPEQVFRPDPANRRPDSATLMINGQEQLSAKVQLRHERLITDLGPIALTWAKTNSRRLIVHCMGNAADRLSDGVNYLQGLIPYGDALIFDYPGYGDSAGHPSISGFNTAVKALGARVSAEPYDEVVIWGHSLGGFVCAQLATRMQGDFHAFVFETSASDVKTVANAWVPWYAGPFVRLDLEEEFIAFDNVNALGSSTARILVLGASEDKQLPVVLSRDLAERLREKQRDVTYVELEGASHMNVSEHSEYDSTVRDFLGGMASGAPRH